MVFQLSGLKGKAQSCQDLVIKVLSVNSALSPRKIHKQTEEKFNFKVTYQAIHKAVRILYHDGVIKKLENEYYLNPEWIHSLYHFVDTLKEKGFSSPAPESFSDKFDYTQKIQIEPICFVPFMLGGSWKGSFLPEDCKLLNKDKVKIIFEWRGRTYFWYNTLVCVQITTAPERTINIIDFFLERRKKHQDIINYNNKCARDIIDLTKMTNPSSQPKILYVMSIHGLKLPPRAKDSELSNILRLLTDISILGLVDSSEIYIGQMQIAAARRKLIELQQKDVRSTNIFEIHFNEKKKVFSSWGNVVFLCPPDEYFHLSRTLLELEADLQHLWYYFYFLKKELRKSLRSNTASKTSKLKSLLRKGYSLWDDFGGISASTDSSSLRLREALIKTSRIERLTREVENLSILQKSRGPHGK